MVMKAADVFINPIVLKKLTHCAEHLTFYLHIFQWSREKITFKTKFNKSFLACDMDNI